LIIGIGIDLVDIARIETMLRRNDGQAARKLLTVDEAAFASTLRMDRREAEWVAGRFAAKEAFMKAMGIGLSGQISMQDIEILPDRSGKPVVKLSQAVQQMFAHTILCHISITHTASTAGAVIIIEKEGGK